MKYANILFAATAAIAAIALCGCETESAGDVSITLTPTYAALEPGQTVVFTATGGWNYKWGISDSALGTLDKYQGGQVVYTCKSSGGTQTVTVTGMSGSGESTSYQATATIVPSNNANETSGGSAQDATKQKTDGKNSDSDSSNSNTTTSAFKWSTSPSSTMKVGGTQEVSVTGYTSKENVEWSTSASSIIDMQCTDGTTQGNNRIRGGKMKLTAKAAGTATITAQYNGKTVSKTITVTES